MRRSVLTAVLLSGMLCGVAPVRSQSLPQSPQSCEDQLAAAKLELAIADRAMPLHDQAFQQAARQLRQEVAGEWAKANARAERETKRAEDALKQLTAAKPSEAKPASPAPAPPQ